MSKTNKTIILVAVIIAIAFFVYAVIQNNQQTSGQFKIGLILPLTGDLASLGENAKNSAQLAWQNLPQNEQSKIQLLFEDDQFNPQNTVSAFNKLVSFDKVNAVVCFTSGPCNAIAPIAEQKQVPLIAIASDPKIQKGKTFVFRLEIAPSQEVATLLGYLKSKNYQKIASVVAVQDGIQAGYGYLKQDSWYSNREIESESVNPSEKDFRTILTKMILKKPDVIFVGLLPGMAGEFGKQARTLGYTGTFVGFNFLEGQETLDASQGKLDGIVYTNAAPAQDWFVKKYQQLYNSTPGEGSAHTYDATMLLILAIENNQASNVQIASFLNNVSNYSGALGTFSSTKTHEFTVPIALKTIRNNQFQPYK